MKELLKNYKVLLLVVFVVVSIILIGPNPNPVGVKINYIGKNATVTGLTAGDIVYKINDAEATTEINEKEYYGDIKLETSKGVKYVKTNGSLGISVEDAPFSNLEFGIDIKGGVRALVKPNITDNTTMERTISTLQTRINIYGLRECNFMPMWYEKTGFIEITMAGGNEEELKALLEHQGRFEAKVPVIIKLTDKEGSINLDKEYKIQAEDDTIKIDGVNARVGDNFTLVNIPFFIDEINDDTINLTSTVYAENDIVVDLSISSRTEAISDGYRWSFPVKISPNGAEKFAMITQNIPLAPATPGEAYRYLESRIYLYLDGDLLDSLNIRSGLKGKVVTEISIEGWAKTIDGARNERTRLQSILKSGALPTTIEIVQVDKISPKLGVGFLSTAAVAGSVALMAVSFVVLIRYRRPSFMFRVILMSLCELIITLGIASLIKWTIDLSSIAGLIAAIGTGVDSEIIMLDEAMRGERKSWTLREKIANAFFIIFGSGGTMIAAMFPLMIFGFGLLRGFAIVTMIGVLVGVLITRPAFGVILEKMVGE